MIFGCWDLLTGWLAVSWPAGEMRPRVGFIGTRGYIDIQRLYLGPFYTRRLFVRVLVRALGFSKCVRRVGVTPYNDNGGFHGTDPEAPFG